MKPEDLSTKEINTWCPGCPNFGILQAVKEAVAELAIASNTAIVTGIGCHAKIYDYLNLKAFYGIHGRVLPIAFGTKLGDPQMTVIGFGGDGDTYAEGMEHFIHHCRYNADLTMLVHNNQVFALTAGQPTPTTEIGFKDKTTPNGVKIQPLNPLRLMLASGASFVARTFAEVKQLEYVFKEGIKHNGFSFIEVLQPCLIFHPDKNYKEKIYSLEESGHDKNNFDMAWKKAGEFDYNVVEKIPVGVFYQAKKPVFEEQFQQLRELKKKRMGWVDIHR